MKSQRTHTLRPRSLTLAMLVLCTARVLSQSDFGIKEISVNDAINLIGQNRGSVVMFHVYASWCGPCRHEFPDVNRLGMEYGRRGLTLLALSIDDYNASVAHFLSNNDLSFVPTRIRVERDGELVEAVRRIGGSFKGSIPYSAIFDRSGRLVADWTGSKDFERYRKVIEPLLAEAPPKWSGRSGNPYSVISAGLSFSIREHQSLRIAQRKANMCILTRDGKLSQTATDDPLLIIGSKFANAAIKDLKKFSEDRLYATGSVNNIALKESREVLINDLPGFEIIADARDTDIDKPVVIYQTVLFGDNRYYLIQGFTRPEDKNENIEAFRSVASSFQRK